MPYHYGWCSNRFFLINYGFCLPNNPMDAVSLKMKDSKGADRIVLLHRDGSQKKFLTLCHEILNGIMGCDVPLRLPALTYGLALL